MTKETSTRYLGDVDACRRRRNGLIRQGLKRGWEKTDFKTSSARGRCGGKRVRGLIGAAKKKKKTDNSDSADHRFLLIRSEMDVLSRAATDRCYISSSTTHKNCFGGQRRHILVYWAVGKSVVWWVTMLYLVHTKRRQEAWGLIKQSGLCDIMRETFSGTA